MLLFLGCQEACFGLVSRAQRGAKTLVGWVERQRNPSILTSIRRGFVCPSTLLRAPARALTETRFATAMGFAALNPSYEAGSASTYPPIHIRAEHPANVIRFVMPCGYKDETARDSPSVIARACGQSSKRKTLMSTFAVHGRAARFRDTKRVSRARRHAQETAQSSPGRATARRPCRHGRRSRAPCGWRRLAFRL